MGLRGEYRRFAAWVVSVGDFFTSWSKLRVPSPEGLPAQQYGQGREKTRPGKFTESAWHRTLLGSAAVTLWLSKKLVQAVEDALSRRGEGPMASGQVGKLGKSLRARGLELTDLETSESKESAYAAILIENIVSRDDWAEELSRLRAILKPRARIISVDTGPASEVSRRFLCGGLSDIHQQEIGRQILTSGTAG